VLGCIAQSFNTYYKEFLIGKELYLICPNQSKKEMLKKNVKDQEKEM
jgi:hypothetical protein